MAETLSLAELESFDPRAARGGRERRFCCPLPGICEGKPIDAEHRCLAVNIDTGEWCCHRCKAGGLIKERWTKQGDRSFVNVAARKRAAIKAKFEVKPKAAEPKPKPEELEKIEKIRAQYPKWAQAFPGSPAARYLESRGIPEQIATVAGCGYAAAWEHWEKQGDRYQLIGADRRVVFPIRDRQGELVAVATRAIDLEHIAPNKKTIGPRKLGVFATPGALEAKILIIAEAAIDAMSLAVAGYPAIALIGLNGWPEWLLKHCAFEQVGIAFDADDNHAGDQAAEKLTAELNLGAPAIRLRPVGGKDWNDLLLAGGAVAVRAQVSAALGIEEPHAIGAIQLESDQEKAEPLPVLTCLPNPAAFTKTEATGATLATIEQCCNLLTRASEALAVVITIKAGCLISIHHRHPMPDRLLAELQAHGAAIGAMMRAGRLADNYCLDCGRPLSFDYAEQYHYIRAICASKEGCGWMRMIFQMDFTQGAWRRGAEKGFELKK